MNILIINNRNPFSHSPRSFRTKELACELARRGHKVDLLIGQEETIIHNFNENIKDDGIVLDKNPKNPARIQKFGFLHKSFLFFKKKILAYFISPKIERKHYFGVKKLLSKNKNYDVVIGIGRPFYIFLAVAMTKFKNTKILFDIGDPFYGNIPLAPYWKQIQRWTFSKADYICIPTEKAIPAYEGFVKSNQLRIIPQGVDFSQFTIAPYRKNPVPTFAYAGRLYDNIRNPKLFLEYLVALKQEFKFYLYTDLSRSMNQYSEYFNALGNKIEVLDFLERRQCVNVLSRYDFLINFENSTTTQVPSKIIDYGITGRPIISINTVAFNPKIFNEFLEGNYSHRMQFDITKYDIKNVTAQFEKLF